MAINWNNEFYEKLIKAFCKKAEVEQDAVLIFKFLNSMYGTCYLPNLRTFERFLNGETKNPRESVLGFMSAYVLDVPKKEIERADLDNSLVKYFYEFMHSFLDSPIKQNTGFPMSKTPTYSSVGLYNSLRQNQ